MEKSICIEPGCPQWGRYCRVPWHKKSDKPPGVKKEENPENKPASKPKPRQAPIKKKSKERAKVDRKYSKETKPLWKDKPCQVRSPVCVGEAGGMHHLEGKENTKKLLNTKKQIPCCNPCNTYIEENHDWAVQNGFKLKRNTKTDRYDNTYLKPE